MKFDKFGQAYSSESELCDLLYKDPGLNLNLIHVEDALAYNQAVTNTHAEFSKLQPYVALPDDTTVDEFDQLNQKHWFMPEEYQTLDIAQHILNLCKTDAELQRVGEELFLFQERNLFPLLCYLKYFVDTMRKHNIVWGLGRGSSTASYILYLLGVHKIDSLYYDLPIEEFLK
jgi:DNA polymerase III alpha subunit